MLCFTIVITILINIFITVLYSFFVFGIMQMTTLAPKHAILEQLIIISENVLKTILNIK